MDTKRSGRHLQTVAENFENEGLGLMSPGGLGMVQQQGQPLHGHLSGCWGSQAQPWALTCHTSGLQQQQLVKDVTMPRGGTWLTRASLWQCQRAPNAEHGGAGPTASWELPARPQRSTRGAAPVPWGSCQLPVARRRGAGSCGCMAGLVCSAGEKDLFHPLSSCC